MVAAAIETSPPWKPELPSMEFLESSSGSKEEKPWCSLAHMFGFNPGLISPVREATCHELTFSLPPAALQVPSTLKVATGCSPFPHTLPQVHPENGVRLFT